MKDDLVYLKFILRAISEIEEFTQGGQNDYKTLMAVRKEIEILGEAANHISPELQLRHTHIAWKDMIATRHRLSHEYFGINAATIWNIVENYLPNLKRQIADVLAAEEKYKKD